MTNAPFRDPSRDSQAARLAAIEARKRAAETDDTAEKVRHRQRADWLELKAQQWEEDYMETEDGEP